MISSILHLFRSIDSGLPVDSYMKHCNKTEPINIGPGTLKLLDEHVCAQVPKDTFITFHIRNGFERYYKIFAFTNVSKKEIIINLMGKQYSYAVSYQSPGFLLVTSEKNIEISYTAFDLSKFVNKESETKCSNIGYLTGPSKYTINTNFNENMLDFQKNENCIIFSMENSVNYTRSLQSSPDISKKLFNYDGTEISLQDINNNTDFLLAFSLTKNNNNLSMVFECEFNQSENYIYSIADNSNFETFLVTSNDDSLLKSYLVIFLTLGGFIALIIIIVILCICCGCCSKCGLVKIPKIPENPSTSDVLNDMDTSAADIVTVNP
ncbi:hypothetical protein TVAG_082180 [Trichomonas vaginalis G3]|uniref:Uncharacterized protein n=1 Tax=Trichomonas vaginalis (strain ATCC PRA-98 / G3) TaxID=412133 RepID=A2FM44_TRIV3|nr:hypothetical protein TVAGG3_0684870 [Trichomonas vaginalis G3]EAX94011.1 hypothetical protein TVAG_082180 [Trichomonas vaginalis G3]KAI5508147.1 hypothetical protein TVAGG3_0684870 [Trichomonas vaginalis G3]|eukprot:XP_001306941.1 hypothetical protein [Trichomonas vaginalis G3]